jgi:hypothetical protein
MKFLMVTCSSLQGIYELHLNLLFLKHSKKTIRFPQTGARLSLPSRLADLSLLSRGLIRRKQSMKKGQRRARRMALYLSSIGIPPVPSAGSYKQWAAVLQAQYNALEVGQRKLARQTGRRLFKESGSIAIAVASLANPVALQPEVGNSPPVPPRTRSREDQFDNIRRRWSALTPPCPACRMRNGFSKRSWPTRKWADEVWGRQHDRDTLRVYVIELAWASSLARNRHADARVEIHHPRFGCTELCRCLLCPAQLGTRKSVKAA